MHLEAAPRLNSLLAHCRQVVEEVAPTVEENLTAGHVSHTVALTLLVYFPAGQSMHLVWADEEKTASQGATSGLNHQL